MMIVRFVGNVFMTTSLTSNHLLLSDLNILLTYMYNFVFMIYFMFYFVIDYKIERKYIQIFNALKSCHRHNRNIGNCLPVLQKRGMIGKGHVFKKYGYGYGLDVTFVKKGIVYEKRCELKISDKFSNYISKYCYILPKFRMNIYSTGYHLY
jgi:hypothetical protein